jgi:putative ABC transport system permease protein
MSVEDRIAEHAVLQTLGFSGPRVFGFVVLESMLLSMIGGVFGIGAALWTLHWSHLSVGAEAVTLAFTPSPQLALTGFGVAALAGFIAGIAPAWCAARTEIVTALRHT